MAYKDGEIFTTYCDKPYDKHMYKMNFKDGSQKIFDDYTTMRSAWYSWRELVSSVDVIDAPVKRGVAKGF